MFCKMLIILNIIEMILTNLILWHSLLRVTKFIYHVWYLLKVTLF
jgi:hypothetical protein